MEMARRGMMLSGGQKESDGKHDRYATGTMKKLRGEKSRNEAGPGWGLLLPSYL